MRKLICAVIAGAWFFGHFATPARATLATEQKRNDLVNGHM